MIDKNVAIIGMGWLGKPLALSLKNSGFKVLAGTRNENKAKEFNELGLIGFQISYEIDSVKIHITKEDLEQIDNLIICIPPSGFTNYDQTVGSIVSYFRDKTKIIFTSSTGAYAEVNGLVTEDSQKIQDRPVFEAEQKIKQLADHRLTILRLAGLIGEDRHPVKYFIKNNLIPNSSAPVNLVCQNDVIRAIELILRKQLFGKTYNIVNPNHPSKKDYYLAAAKELFGEIPKVEEGNGGKLVLGTKFEQETGFKYESRLEDWSSFFKPQI